METAQLRNEFFARETDLKDVQIAGAHQSYLFDENGRRFIDFDMGWGVGSIGWNNEEVTNALRNFRGPSYVSPHLEYGPWVELSKMLAEITPGKLQKCFRATGGTEAVEIALTAAMEFTGRNKFIGIDGAYHGNSLAARGLVSDVSGIFDWKKLRPPLNTQALDRLETLLKSRDVAAFVMEPVITDLGVLIPDSDFMENLKKVCHRYGTLLIMDEIVTGFWRTGKAFACEHFELEPDIMCLAKAITGGAAGLGAAIMTEEVGESLENEHVPYSTYGWHPLSVEAAIANIRYMQINHEFLAENIRSLSEYFRQRLSEMAFQEQPKISVMGLAISMKFENRQYAAKVSKMAKKKGLIISSSCSMFPALNIDFEVAREGLDLLEESLNLL